MSTTDRSHREGNELVEVDDLADPQLEPPAPEPVVANADAELAAAAQRQVAGQDEDKDTESIHRRVFTGDMPPGPPPPREWTLGGSDDGAPPAAPGAAADDEPLDAPATDAWSRRRGPPPPVSASFSGEGSWATPPRAESVPHASAHGPSWARPAAAEAPVMPPPATESSWARS